MTQTQTRALTHATLTKAHPHARKQATRRLLGTLAALGRSASEVAGTLRRSGYRGRREDCRACPVANYLAARGYRDVSVSIASVKAYDGRMALEVEPPDAVADFITDFDEGEHVDLDSARRRSAKRAAALAAGGLAGVK